MSYVASKSGTITAGGTAQDIMTAGSRNGGCFYNLSDTTMYLDIDATATTDSLPMLSGDYFELPKRFTGRVSVLCATTGKKFWAKEF